MEHEQAIPEKSKQHLAEERTEWAHERTLLAKERTFSAWLRTGLATVATGFGATRLLRTMEPRWIVLVLGAVLIVSGGVIFALAFWRYRLKMDQLEASGVRGVPTWIIGSLTLALLICTGLGLALILID